MQNKFFAVMVLNGRTNKVRCKGIFHEYDFALELWKNEISKNRFNYISIYVQPCSCKTKNKIIENDLITRCYNIANCLELAERAFFKRKFYTSKEWFDIARVRSSECALLLNDVYGEL